MWPQLICVYLQMSDDWRVIVDGFAVDGLPHALTIKGELLHGLLLGEVWPLIEDLPRCLVLETWHVEEPLRRANVCRHFDNSVPAGWNTSLDNYQSVSVSILQVFELSYIKLNFPCWPSSKSSLEREDAPLCKTCKSRELLYIHWYCLSLENIRVTSCISTVETGHEYYWFVLNDQNAKWFSRDSCD